MDGRKVIYKGGSFDITLREAMFSIVIVLLMLTAGFFISENIASRNDEAYQEYYEAIKIDEDSELFRYGMRTDVGKAFVFGTLAAVDVVTDPAIEGEYAYIEVVEEHKVKHTRTRTVDGKKKKETYWSWDEYDRWERHCDAISFLGVEFPYGKIPFPAAHEKDVQSGGYHIRYVYNVVGAVHEGTIYTELKDDTVSDNTMFIQKCNVSQAVQHMVNVGKGSLIAFWVFWILLTCAAVYGFCYADNRWLEDK